MDWLGIVLGVLCLPTFFGLMWLIAKVVDWEMRNWPDNDGCTM